MANRLNPLTDLNRAIRENDLAEVTRQLGGEPGLEALEFASGLSRWRWRVAEARLISPFGLVRGGCLATFGDALISSAIGSLLGPNELATTAEVKISFIRPASAGVLHGEGRVIHKGSRVAFVEGQIRDGADHLVATVSSTWTVVRSA